jgi:hypothetical protein
MPKGRRADPGVCSLPHGPAYTTKAAAEATGGRAKRCGRCRQWYVPAGKGG